MIGLLIKQDNVWVVQHGEGKEIKIYSLCSKSTEWSQKTEVQKFIKEGVEVIFNEIVKGEYCETKEMMIKNYFAKIIMVEHESI
jgi:hypothetical protein